jgi:cell wall-associated NlpC family hydrolase
MLWLWICGIVCFGLPVSAEVNDGINTRGIVIQSVSMRDKPDTSSGFIKYLKINEEIQILKKVNPYWYFIRDTQGIYGYVSSKTQYIQLVSNAIILQDVSFRTQPSSTASRIRLLKSGEYMLVLEKTNAYWYKAKDRFNQIGYFSLSPKYSNLDSSVIHIDLPRNEQIEQTIQTAMQYLGTPYEFSSERFDPKTFDCSDFIQQVFWDSSPILLPSSSRSQGEYILSKGNYTTDWKQLNRGDLLFFMSYIGSKATYYEGKDPFSETITHAGIYLGDGKMINTRSIASGGVRIDDLTQGAWSYRFLYGGSAWN